MESHGDVGVCRPGEIGYKRCNNGNLPVRRGAGRHWNDKGALRMNVWNASAGRHLGRPDHDRRAGGGHSGSRACVCACRGSDRGVDRRRGQPARRGRDHPLLFQAGARWPPRAGPDRRRPEGADRDRPVPGRQDQPGRRPARRRRGRKRRDRPHCLRGQQEGQGRAAFGGNPVQAARHVLASDGAVRRPAHRRNLSPLRPL